LNSLQLLRKPTTLFFLAVLQIFPFLFFCSIAHIPPGQTSKFVLNLIVDEMSEENEERGGVIRTNADFDEKNRNAKGNPLFDYQPDEKLGHSITQDDPNLKDASLSIHGKSGRGKWRLIFPQNIMVWRKKSDDKYEELISSRFSDEMEIPFSCQLKVEGIRGSQVKNDVKIVAEFVPAGSKEAFKDSVFLTVLETKFVVTFDDGPLPEKTEKIVRALKNFYYDGEPIRTAFFQVGTKIRKFADLTRFVDQSGHLIFNRALTLERQPRSRMNAQQVESHILLWEEEIYKALGRKPERVIRSRFLTKDGRFEKELEKLGVRICGGELTFDFRAPSVEILKNRTEKILEGWNTEQNPQLHPYPAILIFHEFPEVTYNHIGEIISYLQDRGFLLVNFDLDLAY